MTWIIDFFKSVTYQFNALVNFMKAPISFGSDSLDFILSIFGVEEITPLMLLSTLLITFILSMFILRVVRG